MPLHAACPPSAHREKWAQQPTALQPQLPGSTNTEWQSVRASHAASVATFAQGAGAGQTYPVQATASLGPEQPANVLPPEQLGQYPGVQPLVPLHETSLRPAQVG